MAICHKRKLVFLHIPKNGGTFIKEIPFLTYRDENSPVGVKPEHLNFINLPKTIHISHQHAASLRNIIDGTIGNIEDLRCYIAKKNIHTPSNPDRQTPREERVEKGNS